MNRMSFIIIATIVLFTSSNMLAQDNKEPNNQEDYDLLIRIDFKNSEEDLTKYLTSMKLHSSDVNMTYTFNDKAIATMYFHGDGLKCETEDFATLSVGIKDKKVVMCSISDREE